MEKQTPRSPFTDQEFATVFDSYWRTLYAIAYRRLRDEEIAKDIVQDVFVDCWQRREHIQINTSVEAYLRQAVQYQLIAHFRKLDVQQRAFSHLYDRMVEVEAQMNTTLEEQDLEKSIDAELQRMPDTMREIFRLRIADYTVREIALSLNLAEKTVRNNISRGLQRIRTSIKRDFPEDATAIFTLIYLMLI